MHRTMKAIRRSVFLLLTLVWLLSGRPVAVRAVLPVDGPLSGTGGAQPEEVSAACRALAWLHTQQLPDGGFGLRSPALSAGSLAVGGFHSSAGATADVVYALALLGEDPAGAGWTVNGHSALDALARLAPDYARADAGQAGKVARAVAAAGGDPRRFAGMDLVTMIEAAYDPKTGRYHPVYAYRNTLAVEGLHRAGAQVPQAALDAIFEAQLADGGWFWSFEGERSDVDTTGRVLQVLAGTVGVRNENAYRRAADYLARSQLPEGGWSVGGQAAPANANSTALAVGGLWAAGVDPQGARFHRNGRGAITSLLAFQEWPGSFAYIRRPGQEEVRLMATIDALVALAPRVVSPDSGTLRCPKSRGLLLWWK